MASAPSPSLNRAAIMSSKKCYRTPRSARKKAAENFLESLG
jgi:hypothetical protein